MRRSTPHTSACGFIIYQVNYCFALFLLAPSARAAILDGGSSILEEYDEKKKESFLVVNLVGCH